MNKWCAIESPHKVGVPYWRNGGCTHIDRHVNGGSRVFRA